MTDYLEELLEQADALLDQVRRLERSGIGPAAEQTDSEEDSAGSPAEQTGRPSSGPSAENAAFWEEEGERHRAERTGPLENRAAPEWTDAAQAHRLAKAEEEFPALSARTARMETERTGPEASVPEIEEESGTNPLLDQVRQMERAVSGSAQTASAGERRGGSGTSLLAAALPVGAGGLEPPGTPGGDWTAGAGGGSPVPSGELRWAELADRAFRRDSRRYDGGFYLY